MPSECDSLFASQLSDDETLFAFYQLLRHKPKVIVVLRSFKEAAMGGPDFVTREAETDCAMRVAGCEWEQWEHRDDGPDTPWPLLGMKIADACKGYDLVIGPAVEEGGHEHHSLIGAYVGTARPDCISYLTYKRGHGRSTEGTEVVPTVFEAEQKRVALDCYRSQVEYEPTAPWFGEDQREFVAR